MDNNGDITFFGLTSFRNQKKKFGIKRDDRRRHFYAIGKTGMGKSNLMENMAIQDIQNGHGIAYVDPHGEGAEKLLDFVPEERIKDVIFFNPADLDFPIAFNVMEKVDFKYRHLVAGGLMGVFKKVWPDVWSARMEYILNNTILALLEYPDSTLLGVNRMLADPEYRKRVVEKVNDPVVKSFWVTEYARYTQRYEIEATAAIQNKVGQFVSNALIRNIIGQTKSTINMRKIMDDGKILILDLSKGRIGEDNSRLLGALLITKIQLAAMSRVDVPEDARKDFYLYVDEFQNFATESFANILSEARKYRLCLIIGHQYIGQLEDKDTKVRDAVFGNVGTMAVFRVGAEDAEFLEKEFSPEFTIEDLVNTAKYNIYLKLMIDGMSSHPFSAITLPPPIPLENSNRDKIIAASRERYGVTKEIIEDKISAWTLETAETQATVLPKASGSAPSQIFPKKPAQSVTAREKVPAMPSVFDSLPQTTLFDAVCSNCGKNTKVIFEPKEGKPVYCKSCLKKMKNAVKTPPQVTQAKEAVQEARPGVVNNIKNVKIENISFKSVKPVQKSEPSRPRKEINLSELKKALDESLQSFSKKTSKVQIRHDSKKAEKEAGESLKIAQDAPEDTTDTTPKKSPEDILLLAPSSPKPHEPKDKEVNEEDGQKGVIAPGEKVKL